VPISYYLDEIKSVEEREDLADRHSSETMAIVSENNYIENNVQDEKKQIEEFFKKVGIVSQSFVQNSDKTATLIANAKSEQQRENAIKLSMGHINTAINALEALFTPPSCQQYKEYVIKEYESLLK